MSFLKGTAVGLLSSLLLLLLIVFGVALTLNMTVLSADFVTSYLDKLDMSSLVEEAISQQSDGEGLPEEVSTALVDAIPKIEPLVKEQVSAAIYPIYDYLKGKSPELNLADTLYDTIHIPDIAISIMEEVDIDFLVEDLIEDFITEQVGEEVPEEMAYLVDYVDVAIAELKPWLKEQAYGVIQPAYDYVMGKSESFEMVIPIEQLIEQLRNPLWEIFRESPPPELAGQSEPELALYFNNIYNDIAEQIPSTLELSGDLLLDPELPAQVAEALSEAEESLSQAREYVGNFQVGFTILIIVIMLLVGGIILINREVRSISRILGITFLSYGMLKLIGIFIARNIAQSRIPWDDMPATLQTWLTQLINSLTTPVQIFSIILIVVGAALLGVSFIYKRHRSASEPEPESPVTS